MLFYMLHMYKQTAVISDDDSRVKVAGFDTDYINANYIDVRYSINCSFSTLVMLSLKHGFRKY